jgi:hypothetical protein
MIRDESEIVYATLRKLILSYPDLSAMHPNGVPVIFDYSPDDIKVDKYPCVGIRRYHTALEKRIDKSEEYAQTMIEDVPCSWYEVGRFTFSNTVALFMNDAGEVNPIPFLRSWASWLLKDIMRNVRFPTIGDQVPGEYVHVKTSIEPFEQKQKLLYAIKLSIDVSGKILYPELIQPVSGGHTGSWIIHQNPDLFKR